MKCPSCQYENNEEALVCTMCSEVLKKTSSIEKSDIDSPESDSKEEPEPKPFTPVQVDPEDMKDPIAYKAAKLGYRLPLAAVGIGMVIKFADLGDSPAMLIMGIVTITAIITGLVCSIMAFAGAAKYGRQGLLFPGLGGFILNGLLIGAILTVFALQHSIDTIQDQQQAAAPVNPMRYTLEELEAMPDVRKDGHRIINAELGFRIELPSDYIAMESAGGEVDTIYSYAKQAYGGVIAINIDRMHGTIGPEKMPESEFQQLRQQLPAGSQVEKISVLWNTHELEGFKMVLTGKMEGTFYSVQIPLAGEAIQINVGGSNMFAQKYPGLLKQLLASLKGKTDWKTNE